MPGMDATIISYMVIRLTCNRPKYKVIHALAADRVAHHFLDLNLCIFMRVQVVTDFGGKVQVHSTHLVYGQVLQTKARYDGGRTSGSCFYLRFSDLSLILCVFDLLEQ